MNWAKFSAFGDDLKGGLQVHFSEARETHVKRAGCGVAWYSNAQVSF